MTRRFTLAAGLVALVALAGWLTLRGAHPRPLHLPDGIIARPLSLDGHVSVIALGTDHLTLRLDAGRVRLTVPPGVLRATTVELGAARVVVSGACDLYRSPPGDGAPGYEVAVVDGAARIHIDGAVTALGPGERARLPSVSR